MANFLTRVADVITPWDRKGEVQRRQDKKKKDDQQANVVKVSRNTQQGPQTSTEDPHIAVKRPVNIFEDLNKNLNLGKTPDVLQETGMPQAPKVTANLPTKPVEEGIQKPKQSLWNKVRDVVDANTDADKYRRTVTEAKDINQRMVNKGVDPAKAKADAIKIATTSAKTPHTSGADFAKDFGTGIVRNTATVPSALLRTGTGALQGIGDLTSMAATAANAPVQLIRHGTVRGSSNNPVSNTVKTLNDKVYHPVNKVIDDTAAAISGDKDNRSYEATQIGANTIAMLVGVGELANAGKVGGLSKSTSQVNGLNKADVVNDAVKGSKWRSVLDAIGRNLTPSGADDVVSKIARPIAKVADVAVNKPIRGTIDEIGNVLGRGNVGKDVSEIGDILSKADLDELVKTDIPVREGINVTQAGEDVRVPVTVEENPSPLIREIGGDSPIQTNSAQAAENATKVRQAAQSAVEVPRGRPDQRIEGVGPNAVDGGNTGVFTKAEIDAERAALDEALANKEINKTAHKAANKELDSITAADQPVNGNPIEVKQISGIPVEDQTVVPTGLPEKPGTVRVTKQSSPNDVKTAAAASQNTPLSGPDKMQLDYLNKKAEMQALTNQEKQLRSELQNAAAPKTPNDFPNPGESDQAFLKRVAGDVHTNVQRAVKALKDTKKMTKAQRAERAAAGQKAYEEAKAAGLTPGEQEAARKTAYSGTFDRQDYAGSPVHSEDEQKIRDLVDEHYKDMPYQAGNVRDAFTKLFHSGEEGHWASEQGNHIIPSDIKNIRKFLNESVPSVDGESGLGDAAASAIDEVANEAKGPGKIAKAIGLQRALRFTADISATGRQALPGALSHPSDFASAIKDSFKVMFSEKNYQKMIKEMTSSKEANYINDRLGAYLSVMGSDGSKADDVFRNAEWADKIPGVKQVVNASERQYNTLLSKMRYNAAKRYIDASGGIAGLEKAASDSGDPENFLKAIGAVTNINTGRGLNGSMDSATAKVLSNVLVSPRGLAARIQRFNPKYYTDLAKTNPAAAKEAIRSMAIQTGVTLGALGAASKAGMYEDGQIKVGNTRYDITGGAANMVRTAARVAQYISGNRETTPFNGAEEEVTRWAKNQLSPFLSTTLSTIGMHQDEKTGEWTDHWGNPVSAASFALDNLTPVGISQTVGDIKDGVPGLQTAANAALNTVGIGVNTYESSADKALPKSQSARDTLKQLQKDKISTASNDINTYVKDGEYEKAQRAAEYNLQALQGDPQSSSSKVKDAEQALQKVKLQADGVPMTDDGITAQVEDGNWDKAAKGYQWKIDQAKKDGEISKKTEKGIQDDIKRVNVAKENDLDPADFDAYKNTSLAEWRAMGDPKSDSYNEEMYQKLYNVDDKLTKAGVSGKSGAPDQAKYSAKKSGKGGKGSRGGSSMGTDFGTLKASSFAPKVQQYEAIDSKSGSVPRISVVRPNIVHRIGTN